MCACFMNNFARAYGEVGDFTQKKPMSVWLKLNLFTNLIYDQINILLRRNNVSKLLFTTDIRLSISKQITIVLWMPYQTRQQTKTIPSPIKFHPI